MVATASYRLLPCIKITDTIPPDQHEKFIKCFPPGVIEVEADPHTGESRLVVREARNDTVSREVLRHEEFKDKVELSRIRDHFICGWTRCDASDHANTPFLVSIESTGAYKPEELIPEAIDLMINKISSVEACMRARFGNLMPAAAAATDSSPLELLAGVAGRRAKTHEKKGRKA